MKIRRVLIAALLCLLFLCACGQEGPAPSPDFVLPGGRELVSLTPEESCAMARCLNANRAYLSGGQLYCYDFDDDWQPVLARYDWKDGRLDGFTVLAEGCVPEYLCLSEGWLYYIESRSGGIERVPAAGGARELLRAGPCDWLCLREGLLYFCDGEGRFLSLDPATGVETTVLAGPCAWAYPLEGAALYLASADGGRLHLCWTEDGTDEPLSSGAASPALIWEDRLWYCSGGALHSVGLDGRDPRVYALPEADGAVELLPLPEGLTVRGIRDENGPAQWAGGPEGPFLHQGRGYRICDWLGGGVQIDTVYEPDQRIRCYLLTDDRGAELSFLAGRTT